MKPVCDYDCFHCPYEDCINDEMRLEDYQAGKEIELISGAKEYKTSKAKRDANKKYYKENKEKLITYGKKYREENKEKVAAYSKKYYEENKEKWKEYNQKSRQKKSSLALARSVGGKKIKITIIVSENRRNCNE